MQRIDYKYGKGSKKLNSDSLKTTNKAALTKLVTQADIPIIPLKIFNEKFSASSLNELHKLLKTNHKCVVFEGSKDSNKHTAIIKYTGEEEYFETLNYFNAQGKKYEQAIIISPNSLNRYKREREADFVKKTSLFFSNTSFIKLQMESVLEFSNFARHEYKPILVLPYKDLKAYLQLLNSQQNSKTAIAACFE